MKRFIYGVLVGMLLNAFISCFYNVEAPSTDILINPPSEVLERLESIKNIKQTVVIKEPDKIPVNKPQTIPVSVIVKDVKTNTVEETETIAEIVKTPDNDIVVTLPTIVAADIPKPEKKLWHIGIYTITNFDSIDLGGFVQKDFILFETKNTEMVAFGRVEFDYDTRAIAGIQVNF